jgi:predicted nuclease of predicted toxin-antitoxin system
MRLLLDENVADSTAELCRELGHDVLEAKREGLEGEEDEALLALAVSQQRVVLSFDKDFGNLIRFHWPHILVRSSSICTISARHASTIGSEKSCLTSPMRT